ncbi:hypothetical protein EV421DRAFT_1684686, partial [Armillaria borealis]
ILGHAFTYCNTVDQFVAINKDLHALELSNEDWEAISMVMKWLKTFCSATTQMLMTTKPILSTTHTVFQGLQNDIKKIIATLPMSTPLELKQGLLRLDAHHKLSDYYYKYDKSPFYTWAAYPKILYTKGLKWDYKNDLDLDTYLESSKQLLQDYFD